MAQHFLSPDRLHDRPWRAVGHPFKRVPSAKRRWTMLLLFVLLCSLIGAYLFVTDSRRVRAMAESELSKLVGGTVSVGRAKLSLFEGLRLQHVNVYVDDRGEADSLVFSANTFHVSYDPAALLAGRLRLTQIVAIDPHVQLSENLDTGKWNYQRMEREEEEDHEDDDSPPKPMPALPEIILRNAQIEYSEVRDGQQVSRGSMTIEGQFAPSSDGSRYTFELQSRGGGISAVSSARPQAADDAFAVGPTVTGTLDRGSGTVTAALRDFRFGKDIRSMLPAQVRAWWDRHSLAGAVDVPLFSYTPAQGETEASFIVQMAFRGVKLTVRPEEWMSRDEIQTHHWVAAAFDAMRDAGMNGRGAIDAIAALVEPSPILLEQVDGKFTFTEHGVTIGEFDKEGNLVKSVSGTLEQNTFALDGRIEGYSPLSPASLRITSDSTQIPAQPRYVSSMPRQVRELYDHLRPQGICTLEIALDRPTYGGRLEVSGAINIVDGNFVFDRFPYPVRGATGRIVFGYDEASGWDQVKLVNLRGKGALGGPNSQAIIKLSGLIAPLTGDAGVQVTVSSDNVFDEPALTAAFPEEVRHALRNLDADGKGEFPKFNGGFECRIDRAVGPRSPWIIEVDVELRDASGKFVAFPYFMDNVTGKLAIREGYVDILDTGMKRGDTSLTIGGRVMWRAGAGGAPVLEGEIPGKVIPARPDLTITARKVPIDKELLAALPQDRRQWLEKAGLNGTLDIDGRVWRPPGGDEARSLADSNLTHAFDLTLRDGTIWPVDGTFALSNISARLRLLPDRLIISDVTGKRGGADLAGRGEISWTDNQSAVFVSGTAANLELDRTLYRTLPRAAQAAWDAVKPEGIVNLDLTYQGAVGRGAGGAPTTAPAPDAQLELTQLTAVGVTDVSPLVPASPAVAGPQQADPSPVHNLDLIIQPVKLAATVDAVPYRLENVSGTVRVRDGRVILSNVAGRHGEATIRVSGSGAVDRTDWDLRVSGENVAVDEEFRQALPGGLASIVEGLKLVGIVDFQFPRLQVRSSPPGSAPTPAPAPTAPTTSATTAPAATPLDVDFSVRLAMDEASLDVGVPMTQVDGRLELQGTVRNSKLATIAGPIDLPTLRIADRDAANLRAEFFKPDGHDALRIGKITGELAGGDIAGQMDLGFPEVGPSRYVLNLVLRNADLRELSGEMSQDVSGELSASLALEGDWSDVRTRRGRGDVAVAGKEMYKIPLVLGLLQITNLALPITSPFNHGSARYSVDGQTVTFESLELRSREMLMSGSGQLDFGTKKVRMTFTTDNPNWPKLPIVGDILRTAKQELLQIHVKGTLEEPKVSARAANTLTTTVDEVLRGDARK